MVLITVIGPARAGFLEPGDDPLGASFGGLDGDPQSARGSLKTNPIVIVFNTSLKSTNPI